MALLKTDLKPGVNRKLIAWAFVITGLISAFFWWRGQTPQKISYTVKSIPTPAKASLTASFVQELKTDLETQKGTYAIFVYRLNDKTSYGISETEVMPAASIMKVPIMVGVYEAVSSGDLEMTDQVRSLLTAMGKRSDNAAPVALTNMVGRPGMRQAVADLGMINTNFDQNTTTAADVGRMWQKLYNQSILTPPQREQMWADLQDSIYEERIPAGVPQDITVIHKVGSDLTLWADGGIVMANPPFVLVVLNRDVDLAQAKEYVPKLVKKIFDFETGTTQSPQ